MHWRHVSITMTPCWGSRLVALRTRVVLAERIGAQPLSQCAGPGQPGGMACRGWPSGCMLGDGARGSTSFDPQHAGAPFCDVICIWSIGIYMLSHSIWALFWSILLQNWIVKKHSPSKFRGGACLLHPRLDPPLIRRVLNWWWTWISSLFQGET